jgi:putative PIN family toxin of toxin-antitoxin system
MDKPFWVIDTNTFISAHLIENSVPYQAYIKALDTGNIAISESLLNEYMEVLYRPKFDKYFTTKQRQEFLEVVVASAILFKPVETVNICRDPKDNMFLELALAAKASCLISGDPDLLVLNPFRTIPIMNATEFISHF